MRHEMARKRLTLLETFHAYPGGIPALLEATGLSRSSLYRVAWCEHDRPPVRALAAIARATYCTVPKLVAAWEAERQAKRRRR